MRKPNAKGMLLVLLVAAVMITAGGLSTASNTGFKINKALPVAGAGEIGNNWLSIPYFNPYSNWNAFCTATGLVSTGLGTKASVAFQDPVSGNISAPVSCGSSGGNTTLLPAGIGFRVRNAGTGAPTSIIIVGSHNPTTTFTVATAGTGQRGSSWFAVPYHTTAVSVNDLCLSAGLTSTGLGAKANIARFDAAAGQFVGPATCGTSAAQSLILQLGEAVKIREATGVSRTFVPAHF